MCRKKGSTCGGGTCGGVCAYIHTRFHFSEVCTHAHGFQIDESVTSRTQIVKSIEWIERCSFSQGPRKAYKRALLSGHSPFLGESRTGTTDPEAQVEPFGERGTDATETRHIYDSTSTRVYQLPRRVEERPPVHSPLSMRTPHPDILGLAARTKRRPEPFADLLL